MAFYARPSAPAWVVLLLVSMMALTAAASASPPAPSQRWGEDALQRIQSAFWIPSRGLYADKIRVGGPPPDQPAFMWGCGVQLEALADGARVDRSDLPQALQYASALDAYWREERGQGGYDVLPGDPPLDRYYDDNAWIVLDLLRLYDLTHDASTLKRAEATFRFIMSGEDSKLGGGIYWRENEKTSKNTCSNAPSATAALWLYQETNGPEYLLDGRRIVGWTIQHLQDEDGLFFDSIRLDGSVEKMKWSYNSALMIRACLLLYTITGHQKWLAQAQRIGHAAVSHWVRPDTGAIADPAAFAHLLTAALYALYDADKDPSWRQVADRALVYLHDHCLDANGWFAGRWAERPSARYEEVSLLDQASAACGFLQAARYK